MKVQSQRAVYYKILKWKTEIKMNSKIKEMM